SALVADRPLAGAADDMLGFERLAEGLAELLRLTLDGGLLAGIRSRRSGDGLTSFLSLLHAALASRGIPVIALRGAPALSAVGALLTPTRVAPVVLVDDATPDDVRRHA